MEQESIVSGHRPQQKTESAMAQKIRVALRQLITQQSYPCIAAIKALATKEIRIGTYAELGVQASAKDLAKDLRAFICEQQESHSSYLSFVAAFEQPTGASELEFEERLWAQLQILHKENPPGTEWDPHIEKNPEAKEFCFSFGGHGFFVVGMHPLSSRHSRVFPFPLLVFNLYEQFNDLKKRGMYEPMITINRKRDLNFQGSINPMLTRFGESAEAVQYSGRDVGDAWKCPFKHE